MTTALQALKPVVLTNGLTVYALPSPDSPRLALNWYLAAGNRHEPVPGMQDLLDRLLLKGTTTRDQEAFSVAIDSLSLELDTETRRDCSVISATLLPEDWTSSLELMADVWHNATFDEFEREKERLSGEIAMELDAPKAKAGDLMTRTLFPDHPYGVTGSVVLDQLPHLNDLTALKAHYRHVFKMSTTTLVIAGPLTANWQADIEAAFPADSLPGGLPSPLPPIPVLTGQRLHCPVPDSSQCHILQGWLLPKGNHPDYTAMQVLNTILGGAGLSARLFLELRDKQGLAYNVRSSLEAFRDSGLFSLYIGTEPKNLERCIEGFAIEIQKLIDIPVPAQELEEAKQNIIGRRALGLETAYQQSSLVGNTLVLGRDLGMIANFEDRMAAVTAEDVQRVAKTYLTQPSLITYAGP